MVFEYSVNFKNEIYNSFRGDSKYIAWEYLIETEMITAHEIVKALLKNNVDPYVRWSDDGDVGLKSGGFSKGSEFNHNSGLHNPWGGGFYEICFSYMDMEWQIWLWVYEDNTLSKTIDITPKDQDMINRMEADLLSDIAYNTIPELIGLKGSDD